MPHVQIAEAVLSPGAYGIEIHDLPGIEPAAVCPENGTPTTETPS